MSEKIFLGSNVGDLETGDAPANITRVNLSVDSDHYYTAGDDTGRAIEVTCPWGSQEMANSILASVSGKTYQPYTATDALLDPAAEIGDAVTLGGYYSVITDISTFFDRASAPTISAPGLDEIDDEYPYESKERRETNRQFAQTRSLISKTSEEILLQVEKELKGLSASFSVQLDSITSQITGLDGQVSSITQTADAINLRVNDLSDSYSEINQTVNGLKVTISGDPEISGDTGLSGKIAALEFTLDGLTITTEGESGTKVTKINGESIYTDTLYVNAANITGLLTAERLKGNEIELVVNEDETTGIRKAGYIRLYYDEYSDLYEIIIHSAGSLDLDVAPSSNIQITCNALVPSPDNIVDLGTSRRRFDNIYASSGTIQTSDLSQKTDIAAVPYKYLQMLDGIQPKIFKLVDGTSNRYHVGFIAQDVEAAMLSNGVSDTEFAGFVKDIDASGNKTYMLRYTEFIPLLLAKIKQLERRMEGTA